MEKLGWLEAWRALSELPLEFGPPQIRPLHSAARRVLAEPATDNKGIEVLPAGTRLGAGPLAALALSGLEGVEVRPLPRLCVAAEAGSGPGLLLVCAWARLLGAQVESPGLLGEGSPAGGASQSRPGPDLVARLGGLAPEAGLESVFSGVDMAPGGGCALWRGPGAALVMDLPSQGSELLVALPVLVAPLLRRLEGERLPARPPRALLRFSKVQVSEENRWYPGRFLGDLGGASVEHLSGTPEDLGRADCVFIIPAGQWLRDGDPVDWVPLLGLP